MKTTKLLLGMFATCAMLCACSSDEDIVTSSSIDSGGSATNNNVAYLTVRLNDVGAASTRAETSSFEYGTTAEQTVSNAHFYFYDEEGAFVTEGSAWNSGSATTTENEDGNIEFKSNAVVVLNGLEDKQVLNMVTILNQPSGFTAPSTLDEMEATLADASGVGIQDGEGNFVMSTSSYISSAALIKPFVTAVTTDNFATSADDALDDENITPVDVYVERLAAKVTLKTNLTAASDMTVSGDGNTYYKVTTTVAGTLNDADVSDETNDTEIAAEDVYVKLLGWRLNATAKHSNIVKNIDNTTNWPNTDTGSGDFGFVWNVADYHRSYWGKSFNYGVETHTYPTTAVQSGDETDGVVYYIASTSENSETQPLEYYSLNDESELLKISDTTNEYPAYCAENTNTADIISANNPNAITSILLKAQVCDETGAALDLVRYYGILYTQEHFINYILNAMNQKDQWSVYVATSEENSYERADADDVELVNISDGKVQLQLKDGTYYSTIEGGDAISNLTTINSNLATLCTDGNATGYAGGLMYYNIPIEHLNVPTETSDTIAEAEYGIVRNHHYVVTISSLDHLGVGIFDPTEVIVPTPETEQYYYLAAKINILSWKLVEQDVSL